MPFDTTISLTLIYLLIGALTGITAGLLGVGGGLIVVPALVMVFSLSQAGGDHVMHLALGTSLATIVVTAISSIRAHQKHQAIIWQDFRKLTPGLLIGSLAGAFLADKLPTTSLQFGFALFVILVAFDMLLNIKNSLLQSKTSLNTSPIAGSVIGVISALTGIGGGSMSVPYLSWKERPLPNAIATSAACGLPIAIAATIGFVVAGYRTTGSVTGYVNLAAFLGIVASSIFFAPFGAHMAHRLPVSAIKKVFSAFLLVVGFKMLWGLIN